MSDFHGRPSAQFAGPGHFTLSPSKPQDANTPYAYNPAPNASPPVTPTGGYHTVEIDRNKG